MNSDGTSAHALKKEGEHGSTSMSDNWTFSGSIANTTNTSKILQPHAKSTGDDTGSTSSSDNGLKWWHILLIVLGILICCCCCGGGAAKSSGHWEDAKVWVQH